MKLRKLFTAFLVLLGSCSVMAKDYKFTTVPGDLMNDGMYYVSNMFVTESHSVFFHKEACTFEILEDRTKSGWHGKWIGAVRPTGFISNECNYLGINE